MKNKRIEWIDIYKAILIFSVVLGHCNSSKLIPYIYAFHMAAFFFISGYTSDYKKYNLIEYIKRKFKMLMVPFFVINIGVYMLQYVMSICGIYKYFYTEPFSFDSIIDLFRYFWTPDLGGATWFLVVLFLASITVKVIYDIIFDNKKMSNKLLIKQLVISLMLLISGYYLFYSKADTTLNYFIDLIPMSTFFVYFGYFVKNYKLNLSKLEKIVGYVAAILIYVWYTTFDYTHIEWPVRCFPNIIIMIIVSLSGIIVLYLLTKVFLKVTKKLKISTKWLEYVGQHSLAILAFHFLALRIIFVGLYLLGYVGVNQLRQLTPIYDRVILSVVTAVIATGLSLLIEIMINVGIKYLKKLVNIMKKHVDFSACILLTILVFVFNAWALTSRNFFVFDDYNNLATLPFSKFSDIISILPTDVYCSRSGGWVIVKILLNIFGTNYLGHAVAMLLLHTLNAILLYFFCQKVLNKKENKKTISLIAALIFALYPVSTFASFWEAGMFDLFGFTLCLICMNIFIVIDDLEDNEKTKKVILAILLMLIYYISLRTKEMFIGLPVGLFAYSFIRYHQKENQRISLKTYRKKDFIKRFLKKNIYLIVTMVIMLSYFAYSRYLNSLSNITHDINDAYYYTFNPIGLIKNLYIYIYAYFNTNSLVYGNVTDIIKFTDQYKISILILIIAILYLTIKKYRKQDYTYLVSIGFFLVIILPVLPMPNMHHVLYLYAPSAFLSIIIANICYVIIKKIINNNVAVVILTILILLIINHSTGIVNFRNYWTDTAFQDKQTYKYLTKISKRYSKKIKKVYVINVPKGYTSFTNGPGYIIQSAFNNNKIKIFINKDNYNLSDDTTLVIDYNNTKYRILK